MNIDKCNAVIVELVKISVPAAIDVIASIATIAIAIAVIGIAITIRALFVNVIIIVGRIMITKISFVENEEIAIAAIKKSVKRNGSNNNKKRRNSKGRISNLKNSNNGNSNDISIIMTIATLKIVSA